MNIRIIHLTYTFHWAYADDVHAAESSANVRTTAHAKAVSEWAKERRLQISAPKSHITLFTSETDQSQYRPPVKLDNTPLPLKRHPKLLGVTFDPLLTFHQHTKILKEQATERLKILKALAGINCGEPKETIIMT